MGQWFLIDYANLITSISDSRPTPTYIEIATFTLMANGCADGTDRLVFSGSIK